MCNVSYEPKRFVISSINKPGINTFSHFSFCFRSLLTLLLKLKRWFLYLNQESLLFKDNKDSLQLKDQDIVILKRIPPKNEGIVYVYIPIRFRDSTLYKVPNRSYLSDLS